jgi:hypothetical protein
VATSTQQISHLIARLLQKTQAKTVRWSQTASPGKYQIRFGDFSITISPLTMAHGGQREVMLQVQKLSGEPVTSVSTQQNALGAVILGHEAVDPLSASNLRQLYSMVADRNDDLDDLIKLIG